ncbi:MAG: crossover junction endodeoxyribonuclease RuvC [Lachnospiraceae bacterium]|nr:crossover junction endodeoxyribonuclease RuvC [Lachnospiraceae bacterium]
MYDNTINIMGIDPGNNTGVSVITLDPFNRKIVNVYTKLICLEMNIPQSPYKMIHKTNLLSNELLQILQWSLPSLVTIENVFVNKKFPHAVINLSQYFITCKNTIYNFNNFIKILEYSPKYIKKIIGAGGDAGKIDMLNTLLKNKQLKLQIDLRGISEHEIDSLCIALTGLQEITLEDLIKIY